MQETASDIIERLNARLDEIDARRVPEIEPDFSPLDEIEAIEVSDARRLDNARIFVLEHVDWIEDSDGSEHPIVAPPSTDERNDEWFEARKAGVEENKQAAAARRALNKKLSERRAKKRAEILIVKGAEALAEADAKAKKGAERHAEFKQRVADRIEFGFRWPGGEVAGEYYGAFRELGVRSWIAAKAGARYSPSVSRFPSIVDKKPLVGRDKGIVKRHQSKLIGLDYPYVTVNRTMISVIIVDLDFIFDGVYELHEKLLELLPETLLPNLAVCFADERGLIRDPHIIWELPIRSAVWNDIDNPKCKTQNVELYYQTHRALIRRLLPIGADPGQCGNPFKCKNPLSPFCTSYVLSERWNTLSELIAPLEKVGEEQLALIAATERNSCKAEKSLNIWNTIGSITADICRAGYRLGDKDHEYADALAAKDAVALGALLKRRTIERLCEGDVLGEPDDNVLRVVNSRCTFAAKAAINNNRDIRRGRDAKAIRYADASNGGYNVTQRRQLAQKVTVKERNTVIVSAIAEAMTAEIAAGGEPQKYAISRKLKSAGICKSPQTVSNNWDEALKMLAGNRVNNFHSGLDI